MSVIVILEAGVKEGKKDALIQKLAEYLPETRKYKGCISIRINSKQNSNDLLFYQEWESIQAYETYLKWRTETGVMDVLGSFLISPPSIQYYSGENI
jgi:quinol monooxygenase YgiN